MHPPSVRAAARRRVAAGETTVAVAKSLNVAQSAVWRWANTTLASDGRPVGCWVCSPAAAPQASIVEHYVYLLGQFLGDGHVVTRARVPVLRIYATTDYPEISRRIMTAIAQIRGSAPGIVHRAQTQRMVVIQSYWKHWPCVLPQHGPGRKHERLIELTSWQQDLVAAHPWSLIAGLIHSAAAGRSIR